MTVVKIQNFVNLTRITANLQDVVCAVIIIYRRVLLERGNTASKIYRQN